MKLISRILPYLTVGLLLLTACTGVPDDVIQPEQMARLLADIHIGESVVEGNPSKFPTDSSKRAFKQAIYASNGVTPAEVDSSLKWYGYHMDKYVEVYDRTIEMLNEDIETVQKRAGSTATAVNSSNAVAMEGDSVDVWYDVRFRPFSSNLPSDIMPFVLRTEPNWERGDVYTFRSKFTGNSRQAHFNVAVEYDDGSVETSSANLIGDGWHEVKFALDSARQAREIYGTLQYTGPRGETSFVDSISLTRTRWKPSNASLRTGTKNFLRKPYATSQK